MRKPTDRTEAWSRWRQRVEGRALAITTTPECGFYRAKRKGQYVGVQIDLLQEIDEETGELRSEEQLIAMIGDDTFIGDRVDAIWVACGGNPISEQEFERLLRMPAVSDLSRQVIT
jgi:hypothetical protein